ncbi:nitrite reductase small subunit NirD [Algibacter lectus]|uniref:Nitrite reductase (NADH) small subunit n=1 Tax=Algibacter lectus TaxID=221126 RepID=A0A090WPQ0_9FLAO|nr:nitrite reductase small subunit NirD [Algibacter lectus]MDO7136614.1 nitrite reductase small subunit NirD [Algibacter lectus]MWW23826.1 nitrite reductase small subunit NirD [Algibacter lectus]TDY63490.1 nitrite reductase (NADH) small subunit [Algibacter lectus]SFC45095.1 assimilatory nitrite reductase (NAD(P)H) small subunit [Algibacter lectus]GAL61993.1 nitrite reductase [NAD(P)H] large subunit [Algibacter lectus]
METLLSKYKTVKEEDVKVWFKAASVDAFPKDGGACVKYKDLQIAVFNFSRLNTWYACQNLSPEKQEMVLSRGMLGDHKGIPKIACPLHKKTFSLLTGENLNGDLDPIATYPVKIEGENVYIGFSD